MGPEMVKRRRNSWVIRPAYDAVRRPYGPEVPDGVRRVGTMQRQAAVHASVQEALMTIAVALLVAADLFAAIRAQDLKQVEGLLAEDPSLASQPDENGSSPVSVALG